MGSCHVAKKCHSASVSLSPCDVTGGTVKGSVCYSKLAGYYKWTDTFSAKDIILKPKEYLWYTVLVCLTKMISLLNIQDELG